MTPGEQLAQALRAEITALETVLAHLDAEQQALRAGDAERIEACTRAKDAALKQLAGLQQQRPTAAAEATLSSQISVLDNATENRELQARLIALGERCAELNASNGVLIGRLTEHTRSALRVLRQQDGDPRLYSGTGAADSASDSQSLGKA